MSMENPEFMKDEEKKIDKEMKRLEESEEEDEVAEKLIHHDEIREEAIEKLQESGEIRPKQKVKRARVYGDPVVELF